MLKLQALNEDDFIAKMSELYGEEAAPPAYKIMKANIKLCFEDDSE